MARKPPTPKAARKKTTPKAARKKATPKAAPAAPEIHDGIVEPDHPAWEKAKDRLATHTKYGEHRMGLLRKYAVYAREYQLLRRWLEGFVSGACGSGRSREHVESTVRQLREAEQFEERWCVRIRISVSSRGELDDVRALDDIFTDQPRYFTADMVPDVTVDVGHDEERYILVDSRAPRKEID